MFPLGLMQINSLSTIKSLRSLFLFIIFSTVQTDYPFRINILINNSPMVRVQKAYFLEACLGNSTSLLSTIVLAIFCKSRRYLPSDTLKLYIILSLTISLLQSGVRSPCKSLRSWRDWRRSAAVFLAGERPSSEKFGSKSN